MKFASGDLVIIPPLSCKKVPKMSSLGWVVVGVRPELAIVPVALD